MSVSRTNLNVLVISMHSSSHHLGPSSISFLPAPGLCQSTYRHDNGQMTEVGRMHLINFTPIYNIWEIGVMHSLMHTADAFTIQWIGRLTNMEPHLMSLSAGLEHQMCWHAWNICLKLAWWNDCVRQPWLLQSNLHSSKYGSKVTGFRPLEWTVNKSECLTLS